MRRLLEGFLVLIAFLGFLKISDAQPLQSTVLSDTPACVTQDILRSVTMMLKAQDVQAALPSFTSERCIMLKKGEVVYYTGTGSGNAKIRRRGDPIEYWADILSVSSP